MRTLAIAALAAASLSALGQAQTLQLEVELSGAQSTPPNTSTANGHATLNFNPATGDLSYDVSVSGMTATVAHIHVGAAGTSGGVAVPLASVGANQFQGIGSLTNAQVTDLVRDRLYINVHSAVLPAGEIRGQINMPRFLATPDMNGAKAVPPNGSTGGGKGRLEYDSSNGSFAYEVDVDGMGGAVTAAHVHNGGPGTTGGIVFGLTQTGPTSFAGNSGPQAVGDIVNILTNNTYINVHTTAVGSGEVRDQVRPAYLNSDTDVVGLANGGKQTLYWQAGASHAGELYLVLGSLSGTAPGLPAGGDILPLNPDAYFSLTLSGAGPLSGALGFLSPTGAGQTTFSIPAGLSPALAGVNAHHAGLTLDPFTGAVQLITEPVALTLL